MAIFGDLLRAGLRIGGMFAGLPYGPGGAVTGSLVGGALGAIGGGKGANEFLGQVTSPFTWMPLAMSGGTQAQPWLPKEASTTIKGFGLGPEQTGAMSKLYANEQRSRAMRSMMAGTFGLGGYGPGGGY